LGGGETEWCGNRGLSSTRNIFFISTNSVDDMPAFSFGSTAIEVCLSVWLGPPFFHSPFFYPTYTQNVTQNNVPRVREWEGGKIQVPRERPPIQSLSSSGFDASSILMSNQVFFYDCLWCRQCRNSNVLEREPSLCFMMYTLSSSLLGVVQSFFSPITMASISR